MRLFFALWPPPQTAHALAQWTHEVSRETGGSPTASDKIHLTLAFLGDGDPAKAKAAAAKVQGKRHEMPIDHAHYWRHNKIVWVGPEAMPEGLRDLVGQLHAALKDHGFMLEDRPFAAHVTLLRKARAPKALPALPALEWPIKEFVLVRSNLSPRGATYEWVDRYPLTG